MKDYSEDRLYRIRINAEWVEYRLGEVFFLDSSTAFGFSPHIDKEFTVRAKETDDPEIIREIIRKKLNFKKSQIDDSLSALNKSIIDIE